MHILIYLLLQNCHHIILPFLFYFGNILRDFPTSQNIFENIICNDYTVVYNISLSSLIIKKVDNSPCFININNYTQFCIIFMYVSYYFFIINS